MATSASGAVVALSSWGALFIDMGEASLVVDLASVIVIKKNLNIYFVSILHLREESRISDSGKSASSLAASGA